MGDVRAVLLDLDGVVYVGEEPLPGAAATVDWLTRQRIPFRYLTNTTSRPRQVLVDKLAAMGIPTTAAQIHTPAVAAATWLRRRGIEHPALFVPDATATDFAGLNPLPDGSEEGAGAVVVGDLGESWDFGTLNRAFRLLMSDPRPPLIALGLTRYWRGDDGLRLDAGAFVRALEYAAGRAAVVLGKPESAFYRSAVADLDLQLDQVVMIGDDIRTDVQGSQQAGLTGILVRTGKFTPADLTGDVTPDAVLDSIADLPRWWTQH
ncbi:MAG: TIGR01458 family HAD-type hydrolase [Actinomycetes bacterium]